MHAHPAKWAGEVHALTTWAPSLGKTPKVLGHREGPCAVLLSEVEGFPAEEIALDGPAEERMWREAGLWARRLHSIEGSWFGTINADGSPGSEVSAEPMDFVDRTFEVRLREGAEMELFSASEVEFIRHGIKEWLPSLEGSTPCAIHRDYTPRNWMATKVGELTSVIDFEHARWDVKAADMNRWWDYDFHRRPELADAFFETYGAPDDKLKTQIRLMRLQNATGGVVWATKVRDWPFVELNRTSLQRMMKEPRP